MDQNQMLKIFKDEIVRLIPLFNKRYNKNVRITDFDEIDLMDDSPHAANYLRFKNGSIWITLNPIITENNFKSLKIMGCFNNLIDYIRVESCHELLHHYAVLTNNDSDSHSGWFNKEMNYWNSVMKYSNHPHIVFMAGGIEKTNYSIKENRITKLFSSKSSEPTAVDELTIKSDELIRPTTADLLKEMETAREELNPVDTIEHIMEEANE